MSSEPFLSRAVAYGAALWAFVFAAFHFIWAAGWYPLLDAEQASIAFSVPWKWWYDVFAGIMCVVAVPVALAPVGRWGARIPRRLLSALAIIGTGLLVLRAIASLVHTAYLLGVGEFAGAGFLPWEPWFYLGAALFAAMTWRWYIRARS